MTFEVRRADLLLPPVARRGTCDRESCLEHRDERPGSGVRPWSICVPGKQKTREEQVQKSITVGIDWGNSVHQVAIVDAAGRQIANFAVAHDVAGLTSLAERLAEFGDELPVAVERAEGLLVEHLQALGMRVYPLPETLALGVRARRFQFEVEILVRARWEGIPVLEAPVWVSYAPGSKRISHFRPFVDFCRNSETFTRLIFLRIIRRILRRE